ncbi:MAG: DsbA family protein [Proteobacteria bacterium]|jgi:protein-disulfide isomerase|nr:DsbA family protein [Alphaproteobacteria bacterium]NCC03248.1 DsbA family protein [Pseudomonadota bacterium]
MKHIQRLCLTLALCLAPVIAQAEAPAAVFTDEQKTAIEDIVRNLLTEKDPEIIVQGANKYQETAEKADRQKGEEAVKNNKDELFNDPSSPVAGNPKGDVTVVEFFDYNCGYCKVSAETLRKLISEDKNIRVVFKEFPIFGPASNKLSHIALASAKQGKYFDFHMALLSAKDRVTEAHAYEIAKKVGLDVEKLKKEAKNPAYETALNKNKQLAAKIGARGTPYFVVGEKVFGGAIPYEDLVHAIKEERESANKSKSNK